MSRRSEPALLALHGVRVLGGPSVDAVAERFLLPAPDVRDHLLDAQAFGWVTRHDFFGETWSLTDRGRAENERQLAVELDAAGVRDVVAAVHASFRPVNAAHGRACTQWQLHPTLYDPAAINDHSDPVWDDAALTELEACDDALAEFDATLTGVLARFDGYSARHSAALAMVRRGDHDWLDAPGRASCELVWIQFHEDLLATLGLERGSVS
ncbi:MAG: transcriptional regulator [Actinobacteria bacterium]|nr:transcriptional regulator [Actinomycetota bacterium]